MGSSGGDGTRIDCRWKPLREGEISPFKLLVALFIREVYAAGTSTPGPASKTADKEKDEAGARVVSPKTLLLIYNLISSYDLDSFAEMKSTLEKPIHSVRPEALKKFNRIVCNLEGNNSYFLYELANSIVSMESSQMVVLRKRIAKNSPFGKFLRGIYLNVKKLSYPQVDFMYKQLMRFLGMSPGEGGHGHSQGKMSGKDKDKVPRVLKGLDLFQKLEERKTGDGLDLELFHTYTMEYKKMTGIATEAEKTSYEIHADWKAAKAKNATQRASSLRKLWMTPQQKVSASATFEKEGFRSSGVTPIPAVSSDDEGEDKNFVKSTARHSPRSKGEVSVKRITRSSSSPIGKGGMGSKRRSSSLRRIYFSSPRPRTPMVSSSPNLAASGSVVPLSPGRTTRATAAAAAASKLSFAGGIPSPLLMPAPRLPKLKRETRIVNTGAFSIRLKSFPNPKLKSNPSSPPKTASRSKNKGKARVKKVSMVVRFSDEELDEDVVMKSPSPAKCKKLSATPSPNKSPRVSRKLNTPKVYIDDTKLAAESSEIMTSRAQPDPVVHLMPLSQLQLTPVNPTKVKILEPRVMLGSPITTTTKTSVSDEHDERWNVIKHWSRKQIEKAVKSLIDRLYSANSAVPSPSEITQFIRLAMTNPSGSSLFSHLHYLEYLNCLRIKDVAQCTNSLRASFDVKMKPNTTELNKGTTYAAYNAALFYHQVGYKDDAVSSLDEAFRAGHAAGDATCLHHCHNLWSSFHSKAYTDAIVTVTKEVDNNMAYLHSLNVIVNAFDVHSRGVSPDEVLHSLWHYNADCDLEEMEGLLLSALSNFYTIFGWHEMIAFPAQMILFTNWKWSSRFYSFGLCCLSQYLLYHGDVHSSTEIMEYGQGIFECDASPAGQHFILQHAIFQAIKSYLAYEPVSNKAISTISAFDEIEAIYWRGYNLMIRNTFKEASSLLSKFLIYLEDKQQSKGYMRSDLKLRCLLLLAELECLCLNTSGAINHLSEALDIASTINSDVYITLCLYNAAAVQCEIGLEKTASLTIEKRLRSAIRSANPWLTAKMNVIKAKIIMKVDETVVEDRRNQIMAMLDESENIYVKWGNKYRMKEVLNLKAELIDRSKDLEENGSELLNKLSEIPSYLDWSKETCIL